MELDLDLARKVLAAQPFNGLVGARLADFGPGYAVLEIDIRDDLRQQSGLLHGGVLAYAADNALTFAAGSVAGSSLITAGFTIDYLRPATSGTLRADARVIRAGKSRVVTRCDLSTTTPDTTPTLCAIAQGSVSVLPS